MTDTILKQNAGRGGAVLLVGINGIPAGNYCAIEAIIDGSAIVSALNAPLLEGNQTLLSSIPAGFRIDTPIIGGTGTVIGSFLLYKAI